MLARKGPERRASSASENGRFRQGCGSLSFESDRVQQGPWGEAVNTVHRFQPIPPSPRTPGNHGDTEDTEVPRSAMPMGVLCIRIPATRGFWEKGSCCFMGGCSRAAKLRKADAPPLAHSQTLLRTIPLHKDVAKSLLSSPRVAGILIQRTPIGVALRGTSVSSVSPWFPGVLGEGGIG